MPELARRADGRVYYRPLRSSPQAADDDASALAASRLAARLAVVSASRSRRQSASASGKITVRFSNFAVRGPLPRRCKVKKSASEIALRWQNALIVSASPGRRFLLSFV